MNPKIFLAILIAFTASVFMANSAEAGIFVRRNGEQREPVKNIVRGTAKVARGAVRGTVKVARGAVRGTARGASRGCSRGR